MNRYLVRDLSEPEEIYGIIETDKSEEEIQEIINDVKADKEGCYELEDVKERLCDEGVAFIETDATVYF